MRNSSWQRQITLFSNLSFLYGVNVQKIVNQKRKEHRIRRKIQDTRQTKYKKSPVNTYKVRQFHKQTFEVVWYRRQRSAFFKGQLITYVW